MSNEPYVSPLLELKLPEQGFVSSIPPSLLKDCEPQMAWLMHEVSKNTAATEFACRGAVELSSHLRTLNGKTYRSERGIEDLRAEVAQLKADNLVLKAQVLSLAPIVTTVSTTKMLLTNKVFLVVLGAAVLFALGYNRETFLSIWKALAG